MKKILFKIATISIASLISTSTALAVVPSESATTPKTTDKKTSQNFCTQLGNITTKYEQQLAATENKKTEALAKAEKIRAEKYAKASQLVVENRNKFDSLLFEKQEKAFAKVANNDAKKELLTKFQTAKKVAIEKRRATIDQANTEFKTNKEKLTAEQNEKIKAIYETYRQALLAAENKAKESCQNTDAKIVKETYKNDVKVAREKLTSDKKSLATWKTGLEPLTKKHQDTIYQANKDFRAAVEKAKSEFTEAMKALKLLKVAK